MLDAACREISELSGEPIDAVKKRYNAMRTRLFMIGLQDSLARDLVEPATAQLFSSEPWLDPDELMKMQAELS